MMEMNVRAVTLQMNGSKLAKVTAEFVHLSPEKQNQICEKVFTFYFIMDS